MNNAPKWFAVYTAPRHEKTVDYHLCQRGIERYLPLYVSRKKWRNGVTGAAELPLFPSYIFVRIVPTQRIAVLQTSGVLGIVGGTGREPLPLPDAEIEALRSGLKCRHAEPHPFITEGSAVSIRSGPFQGMHGIVLRKKGSFRVVITLESIMRSIAVEVDETELAPASMPPKSSR